MSEENQECCEGCCNTTVSLALEGCIEQAKEVGAINCAVTMLLADGSVVSTYANGEQPFLMLGALEYGKQLFMEKNIE